MYHYEWHKKSPLFNVVFTIHSFNNLSIESFLYAFYSKYMTSSIKNYTQRNSKILCSWKIQFFFRQLYKNLINNSPAEIRREKILWHPSVTTDFRRQVSNMYLQNIKNFYVIFNMSASSGIFGIIMIYHCREL